MQINDLFTGILNEERNMFTDALLEILEIKEEEKVDFGQFLLMMMTYALFETMEILKFCFFMFDKDKNGFIHKDEFILFVEMIHSRDSAPLSNIVSMVEQLDVDGDGKFTWQEFTTMHKTFPQVLFPCFRLQIAIVRVIFGPKWWKKKKNLLILASQAKEEKNERVKRKQLAMLEKQRQAAIRRDMGFLDFYLLPQNRKYYDSKYPPTTADQLVQLDNTTIEEKLNRLAAGMGSVEYFEREEEERKQAELAPPLTEDDEDQIVEEYKKLDQNFPEIGRAMREGRRIQFKADSDADKKKKKGKKKKGVLDFGAKRYHAKVMDVAHAKVDPNGAIVVT